MKSRWRFTISLRDVQNRLLPLVQALDEKFSGADFFADVIFHLGGIFALRHQVLVDVADAQVGNVLVVGGHDKIVADFLDEHFGQNILVGVRQEGPAGTRFQTGDAAERILDLLHGVAGAAGDFRDAPFAERVHEIAHDAIFERILPAGAFQLQHEAFAQIERADARRIEGLDDFQHLGDFFRRQVGGSRHFLDAWT